MAVGSSGSGWEPICLPLSFLELLLSVCIEAGGVMLKFSEQIIILGIIGLATMLLVKKVAPKLFG